MDTTAHSPSSVLPTRTDSSLRNLGALACQSLYRNLFKAEATPHINGRDLPPGITVILVARDEDYSIPFCLRSLVGFANQVVLVDNGSVDRTLEEMLAFKIEHGHRLDIEILEMPDALLGECRDRALLRSKWSWHLRWDGDMILNTDGPDNMLLFRNRVLSDPRPRTVVLPYLNICGDLHHTFDPAILPTVCGGEPYLMTTTRRMRYREYGRFDVAATPWFYLRERRAHVAFLHLGNLKSTRNRLRRFHYFVWREWSNRSGAFRQRFRTLDSFGEVRNSYLFETNDPLSLRFRFDRDQVQGYCVPLRIEDYVEVPEALRQEYASSRPRFEVEYRGGVPFRRIDREDVDLLNYRPTAEDLRWDAGAFRKRVRDESLGTYLALASRR